MKPLEYYRGREQTYLKHFFLEQYLERVAYNIGSFANEFVYVDGFSGPWRSVDQAFDDSSFTIAIKKLRQVREGLATRERTPKIRCVFVEKDAGAFGLLQQAIADVNDIKIDALNSEFEQAMPEVLKLIGNSFSLVFIDPSGWTGFGLNQIAPLLRHCGEVLVNFMFDYINRFLDTNNPGMFNELFGGPGWESALSANAGREDAIIALYRERMRTVGEFDYVTSTRILKPTSDRAYFYLIYGTRHPKGLVEFRKVERREVYEQERVRLDAKQAQRIGRSGQTELFVTSDLAEGGPPSFKEERRINVAAAKGRLAEMLNKRARVPYEDVQGVMLELPLVWESDVKDAIAELKNRGTLEIEGLEPGKRTPKPGHFLVRRILR